MKDDRFKVVMLPLPVPVPIEGFLLGTRELLVTIASWEVEAHIALQEIPFISWKNSPITHQS